MTYCGRFAPSPTGPLHFGSLVAALGSCCDARAAHGRWLVRIEDVDLPRAREGAADAILRTLEHYGFEWDGPVLHQSTRTARYEAALAQLAAQGDVYACVCSRRELAQVRTGAGGEPVYPGTCRDRVHDEGDGAVAWRLRVDREGDGALAFVDRLQGPQTQCLVREVGDFAVRRRDGLYAYQLAVVVDDAEQGVTDVVRGADLLASTARQIYLQHRLGCATPRYLHLPVAVNAQGEKLSKQTRAPPLPEDPRPALRAVWRFLEQPLPDPSWPDSVPAFWTWALRAWTPGRLPPVAMLPAPGSR